MAPVLHPDKPKDCSPEKNPTCLYWRSLYQATVNMIESKRLIWYLLFQKQQKHVRDAQDGDQSSVRWRTALPVRDAEHVCSLGTVPCTQLPICYLWVVGGILFTTETLRLSDAFWAGWSWYLDLEITQKSTVCWHKASCRMLALISTSVTIK